MKLTQKIALGVAGITALGIGTVIVAAPHAFYASYGIALGPDPSLLSELRAPGAGLAAFGAVMLATRLDKVGEAAALRETSVVFAALIGWLALGEAIGRSRALLMIVIALGAIQVEFG